jgi:hypothetical protein
MVTIILCPTCKGARIPSGQSYDGKRCVCSGTMVAAAAATEGVTDASATSAGLKRCCKCGADVTHAKRMRDHLRQYWCYECGAADQLKKGSGLAIKCPDCSKHFPPTRMLKHGDEYVCESCHAERGKHRGLFGGGEGENAGPSRTKVVAAVLVVVAVAAMLAVYLLDLELFP